MALISLMTLFFGLVSVVLRGRVIDALKEAGVFEKAGSPRRIYYSDLLHFRLLTLAGGGIEHRHRVVFILYFVATMLFHLGLVLILLSAWWR
ncbi:hypothetical protein AB4059_13180 [Lysobacter sp. 2RAF19]